MADFDGWSNGRFRWLVQWPISMVGPMVGPMADFDGWFYPPLHPKILPNYPPGVKIGWVFILGLITSDSLDESLDIVGDFVIGLIFSERLAADIEHF
jgi:hypothetical protein